MPYRYDYKSLVCTIYVDFQTVSTYPPLPLPPRRFSRMNDVSFEPPVASPSPFGLSSVTVAELVIELPPGLAGQPPLVLVLVLLTEWRGVVVPLDVDGVVVGVLSAAAADAVAVLPMLVAGTKTVSAGPTRLCGSTCTASRLGVCARDVGVALADPIGLAVRLCGLLRKSSSGISSELRRNRHQIERV